MQPKSIQSKYTGLTDSEAELIRNQNGINSITSNQKSKFKKILLWIFSPISLMLLGAAGISFAIGKTFDFYFILALYLINFAVGQWQEYKANNAIAALQSTFNIHTLTLRNAIWKKIESTDLVIGDVISLHSGDIIPADIVILESNEASIDESSVTGESETVTKKVHDTAYSGTAVTTGEIIAKITQTGANTRFGKTLLLAEDINKKSSIEKDIIKISQFLATISIVCIIVLSIGLYFNNTALEIIITTDLSLLIAGIPVAMPTVITLIMSLGMTALAKKKVAVRRLSSLEDLANVNLLLSDKTGTLTHHHIAITKVIPFNELTEQQVLELASSTTGSEDTSPISIAIEQKATALQVNLPKATDLIPGDSIRKRTTATDKINGKITTVSVGATQLVLNLCKTPPETMVLANQTIETAAKQGLRTVAIAYNQMQANEKDMTLAGLLLLADEIREDSKPTIEYLTSQGIQVKMVTGDHTAIAKYVAKKVGLSGDIKTQSGLQELMSNRASFDTLAGFAEVFPEDKLNIVKSAKNWYKVAVTGDGANDIPAVSSANVGIAVKNGVDALHSAADIVLLTDGIAVIKDAIIEARKIFTRVFFYSVYRISESFRVILSITILGLIYHAYPLSTIHLLLLALLNDIPIISLAYDKVKALNRPSAINVSQRMFLSLLFGGIGLLNSLIFFLLLRHWHVAPEVIQTAFFLKLTVSGHLLIYVSHTEDRWWKFLPDKRVILATALTQGIATLLALFGIFIAKTPWPLVVLVWAWAIFWMQASELVKWLRQKFSKTKLF